jgi:phosphate acetyltransferase/phosphate butyryltransferase
MVHNFDELVRLAASTGPHRPVIVSPTEAETLQGALLAQQKGGAACTLVGDVRSIRTLAAEHTIDLSSLSLIDAQTDEAALRQALHLCRKEQADVLVNDGIKLHRFRRAITQGKEGLCGEGMLTGLAVLYAPGLKRLLMITDPVTGGAPTIEQRIAAIENAVHVAHRLGNERPHVALVGATESVNPKSAFSVDAAQITVMARRHQIQGALIDGPLGFDNALSAHAAEVKGIESEVAGQVDILVAPDLESAALLVQTVTTLCRLPAVHAIVGGQTPVILWPCGQDAETRMVALALGAVIR